MKKIYIVLNNHYEKEPAFAIDTKEDAIALATNLYGEENADRMIAEIPYIEEVSVTWGSTGIEVAGLNVKEVPC
jgi:hypothetical protein